MPLMPAAVAAMPDDLLRGVRFVMKDGTKPVVIFVSHAALEDTESALLDESGPFIASSNIESSSNKWPATSTIRGMSKSTEPSASDQSSTLATARIRAALITAPRECSRHSKHSCAAVRRRRAGCSRCGNYRGWTYLWRQCELRPHSESGEQYAQQVSNVPIAHSSSRSCGRTILGDCRLD